MLSPHASVAQPSSQASIRLPHHPCAGAPTARATALGIGCGFGLGSAWQQNQVSLVGQAVPCPCQAYHALPPVRLPSSLDEVDPSLLAMPQSAASMLDKLQCPHPRVPIRSGTLPLAVWQQCRQEVMHRRTAAGQPAKRQRKRGAMASCECRGNGAVLVGAHCKHLSVQAPCRCSHERHHAHMM